MSAMTNAFEGLLIDHLFRDTSVAGVIKDNPTHWYVALHTAAYGDDGAGGTEVSTGGTGYARVGVARGTSTWTKNLATNTYTVYNTADVAFANNPTANWGQVTHVGLWTASTSGTLVIEAQLQFAKTINNGDPAPKFVAGDLKFTFD